MEDKFIKRRSFFEEEVVKPEEVLPKEEKPLQVGKVEPVEYPQYATNMTTMSYATFSVSSFSGSAMMTFPMFIR